MVQRRRLNAEVDDEMRRYIIGQSSFNNEIELALERSDPLTRELVFFRASGGDYRQAVLKFHISESTYYSRLNQFRQSLILMITSRSN